MCARVVSAAALLTFWLFLSIDLLGSSFTVNPTQVVLTARTMSALLTLRNDSDEALRFELSMFSWDQTDSGEMRLTSSEDIVFFPRLLTLEPGQERKIRVGAIVPVGAVEKTYRIFVEELPPASPLETAESGVRVLTKMGIPIFLQPAGASARVSLRDLSFQNGVFDFEIENGGSAHVVPQDIRVRAATATGQMVLDRKVDAWYILAGGRRRYQFTMPQPLCQSISSLLVEMQVGSASISSRLAPSPTACQP